MCGEVGERWGRGARWGGGGGAMRTGGRRGHEAEVDGCGKREGREAIPGCSRRSAQSCTEADLLPA